MSDSVEIVFYSQSRRELSPVVYLHWGAESLVRNLQAALPCMRTGDVSYACARFIGYCHTQIPGANSLGCHNLGFPPGIAEKLVTFEDALNALSQSNLVRVNVDQWTVEGLGDVVQLRSTEAASGDGLGANTGLRSHDPKQRDKERQRLLELNARWSGKKRTCPNCGTVFVSVADRGGCPGCRLVFLASDVSPEP